MTVIILALFAKWCFDIRGDFMNESAFFIATERGFPFLDAGKFSINTDTYFCKFFQNAELTGDCLYVGYNYKSKQWILYVNELPGEGAI